MSDEREEGRDEDEVARDDATQDAQEDAPRPATWAGRERAGGDDAESESGITDEFDGLEAELSAEFEEETPPAGEDAAAEEDDSGPEEDAGEEDAPGEEDASADEGAGTEADAGTEDASAEEDAGDVSEAEDAGQRTIEADTLAEADREAAQEAAHAGVKARTEQAAVERKPATAAGVRAAVAEAVTSAPPAATEGAGEPPPRNVWWRFLAASLVIIASMATATAVSFLLFLSDVAEGLNDDDALGEARAQLDDVEGKEPQTILILGSDKRSGTPGDPGRSDTAMLLRVDPDKDFLALLSLPRDLKLEIPGYGTDRLNAAYSNGEQAEKGGGAELMIKTIKQLLGIPINHVVNVDFEGFYEAVNAIDCVYIDVDRHYYHSNQGLDPSQYFAEIDVPAGYTKLCGFNALAYVRYRHTDNDLVRGARQQDFIREARQRIPPRQLVPFLGGGDELIDIFTDNTTSDIDDVPTIIDMLKSFVDVREASVRQVELESGLEGSFVVASKAQLEEAVALFLGNDVEEEDSGSDGKGKSGRKGKKGKPGASGGDASLIDATATAQQHAVEFQDHMERKRAKLPIFYPTGIASEFDTAISDDSRAFAVESPEDERGVYRGYKFVVCIVCNPGVEAFTSYYGVSGINWRDPPILKNPSETRTIDGRDYMLFYERNRLRLVGWKTRHGSYWVNNTLTQDLSEDQMIAIATATRRFKG